MVALPFDNALFHFTTFLLIFLVSLALSQTGFLPLLAIMRGTKHLQIAFSSIILAMAISNLNNGHNGEAWRAFFIFIFRYWLLLFVLLYLYKCRLLTITMLTFATFLSLFIQFLPFIPEIYDGSMFSSRFQGFSSNPNVIGLYAAIGVLLGSYSTKYDGKYKLAVLTSGFALAGMSAIILIASGNRGSWVAVLGALTVFVAFEVRRRPGITAAFLTVIAIFCLFIFSNFQLPMARLNLLIEGYSALRGEVWQNSLAIFWEKPILGHGLDARRYPIPNGFIYSEHNIFLNVLTSMGVAGLAAYIYLLSNVFLRAFKDKNVVGLSFMTLLIGVGMFSFDFYRDQHFMIIFIIVVFLIFRNCDDIHALRDT